MAARSTIRTRRNHRGDAIIEAVTIAIVLIPVALCLLDLIVVVIANNMNDTAAKNAARAAANQGDKPSAQAAAEKALESFHQSSIIESIEIEHFKYPQKKDKVTVQTKMKVRLPIPFPGYNDLTFMAKDVEPIVY
jgi:hypothetical protein